MTTDAPESSTTRHCSTCSCDATCRSISPAGACSLSCLTLGALDDEMVRQEAYLRLLKTRRNELVPVARLPRELLAAVFLYLRPTVDLRVAPRTWIQFSHVCAHWRAVALAYPPLWTGINMSCAVAVPDMLARAAGAPLAFANCTVSMPLSVDPVSSEHAPDTQLELLRRHAPRITRLQLDDAASVVGVSDFEELLQSLDVPMPNLDDLSIMGLFCQTALPENLFAGTTPRLRTLFLSTCRFRWNSVFFQQSLHLRELHMSNVKIPVDSSPPGDLSILRTLAQMREMEIFSWAGDFPIIDSDPDSALVPEIRWPHLRRLSLDCTYTPTTLFLTLLRAPPSAAVIIDCAPCAYACRPVELSKAQALLAALCTLCPAFHDRMSSAELSVAYRSVLLSRASGAEGSNNRSDPNHPCGPDSGEHSLSLQGLRTLSDVSTLLRPLRLRSVTFVSPEREISTEAWRELLRLAAVGADITSLTLRGRDFFNLLPLLAEGRNHTESESITHVEELLDDRGEHTRTGVAYLPRLSSLTFEGVHLRGPDSGEGGACMQYADSARLVELAQLRGALKRVKFIRCTHGKRTPQPGWLHRISQLVEAVDWE